MKRHHDYKSFAALIVAGFVIVSGCDQQPIAAATTEQGQSRWLQPPSIVSVEWSASHALISGVASGGARVVFVGSGEATYAASADAKGEFSLTVRVPDEGLILQPRLQLDRSSVAGPGQLFISPQEIGTAAIVFPGEGAYRLTGDGPLDAVDSDGRTLIISGRTIGAEVEPLFVGGNEIPTLANEDGRWAVVVPFDGSTAGISIGGRRYLYREDSAPSVLNASDSSGWYIRRDLGQGAVQTTWLPLDK